MLRLIGVQTKPIRHRFGLHNLANLTSAVLLAGDFIRKQQEG